MTQGQTEVTLGQILTSVLSFLKPLSDLRSVSTGYYNRRHRPVGLERLDNQMKMVAHQHIGVHADAEDLARTPKSV